MSEINSTTISIEYYDNLKEKERVFEAIKSGGFAYLKFGNKWEKIQWLTFDKEMFTSEILKLNQAFGEDIENKQKELAEIKLENMRLNKSLEYAKKEIESCYAGIDRLTRKKKKWYQF